MDRAIKINETLVKRMDDQCLKYSLGTRQNVANTLIRKGLEIMESKGYEELLKLPGSLSETGQLDTAGQKSCETSS